MGEGALSRETVLLHAAPYPVDGRMRPGRIHEIKDAKEEKTYCGKLFRFIGGKVYSGMLGEVDCLRCIECRGVRERNEIREKEWKEAELDRWAEREREDEDWWGRYNAYLNTPEWHSRRRRVLERAGGLCEGCRESRPAHVHHKTYKHVCNELLFELVALCGPCHQKAHPGKEIDFRKEW